ncbi:uncharacterized protein LOC100881882 [Megachile rotundata]|uniref:uncharacterized protein LOC100881882 n=1 Tax=Megachile rotundata TaxID=143995 RepID=UPI000258D433
MWTVEKTLKLIEDLRREPCLWDRKCEEFKNKEKKRDAMNNLAEKNGVTSAELERKIHSMKTQFYRERRKLFNTKRSNAASKNSNWFGYMPLMFLIRKSETKSSNVQSTNVKEEQIEVESTNTEVETTNDTDQTENENDVENVFPIPEYGGHEVQQNGNNVDSTQLLECSKCLTMSTRDELSTFGEYIACTLRNCNRQRKEIAIAQHQISNILFNLEMGVYSNVIQQQSRQCADTDGERATDDTQLVVDS